MIDIRHVVQRGAQAAYQSAPPELNAALTRWSIVDERTPGATHTEFTVCALAPGGASTARVQSFEECVFVLDGELTVDLPEGTTRLVAGDYGLLPVGLSHTWRNDHSEKLARWASLRTPQPRARYGHDTLEVPAWPPGAAQTVDVRDPRNRLFGHIEPMNMEVDQQRQEVLALSASMRTALLVYSGITVKMMVDSDLGAQLTTMFMVRYEPDGVIGPHDHPFEETYLFLEGEVEATFDGETYRLGPGDAAFAGVGCMHGFRPVGSGPVRWLETQAPQPPGRHSYRFVRDWDYLRSAIGGS